MAHSAPPEGEGEGKIMSIERVRHSGAYVMSEIVGEGE
jgi:hypothetical protein